MDYKWRNTVRLILHKCVKCHRFNSRAGQQLMANLPEARARPSKVFSHVGVDYAGPFWVKMSNGRGSKAYKGYVSLFICMSTKAIHLELVSELTAKAFIAAFKRFTAGRGQVSDLYSDNGTNFVLANKLLNCDVSKRKSENEKICDAIASKNINWHFNPPAAPSFGGLWEAGVRSMKQHLKKTIGEAKLCYEEFITILTQVEACLNSRPLCPVSNDSNDLEVLTPAHFLVGRQLTANPEPSLLNRNENTLGRWQLVQKMTQHFWRRWQDEYLVQLQQRPKWATAKKNVQVGQLVLITNDNQPPTQWPLGRIPSVHPGTDGAVRVVSIKTKSDHIKRPILRISPLPIEEADEDISNFVMETADLSLPDASAAVVAALHTQLMSVQSKEKLEVKPYQDSGSKNSDEKKLMEYGMTRKWINKRQINPVRMESYTENKQTESSSKRQRSLWPILSLLFLFIASTAAQKTSGLYTELQSLSTKRFTFTMKTSAICT